ncbi:restriction endonuclease subunit S [uncultured Gemmiger sp.]|uniref:restriction endonuclease subunit S n=1 Tax=uncultured Gemmiger sp. TaxID=1623490 RepID=UPI0027E147C6|nr:restriction endonuclease subunit S [uncultured Gemmiger sp.]
MARAKKEAALTPEERLQAALVPDWEWPYKLPENWCWTRMQEIAQWGSGGTPSRKVSEYYNGDISWVKTGELNDDYIFETEEHITQEAISHSSAKIYPTDTVVIAMYGATIGKVGILGIPAATNQACACAIVKPSTDYKYLFYYAQSQKDDFIKKGKGGAQPNISQEIIKFHQFPLPPLAEQQRIVDRIESLFAKLDEAKEKAQAVVDSFETHKAAILHKAFTGELTAKWREEHGVSIDNWKTTRFDSVAAIRSNLVDPAEYQSFPHIAPDNIEKKTGVLLEYHTIAEDGVTSGKHRFYSGQILYSKIRPYLSKAVVVDFDGLCSADMYPIEAYQNARCLWYYMLSDEFLLQASTAGSRSVLPKINQKELSALTVHLPTNDREQEEIARILDELFDKEQQTKEAAEIVLDQIELMKKSILARSFRGELDTNDPNEESAVELLRQVIEQEDGDVIRPKAKAKRIAIPAEIKPLLSGANEEAIVKLLLKAAPQSVSTQTVMSISKEKFELMDALRNLEKKQIVSKSDSGEYSLVR